MKQEHPRAPLPENQAADDVAGFLPGGELPDEDEEEDSADAESPPAPEGPELAFVSLDWTPDAGDIDGKVGAEVIQTLVKRLPNAPGVYRMMNAAGDVLYVGKAKNLKKRVTSYAQGRFHSNRIGRMVRETATMEFVVTRTETEALLLEANLIKRLRPRFNVLLRDDKSFPYILLNRDHPAPGIFKHRGARSRKGDYFGPFASAGAVGRTINSLQRAFLLRTCTDSVFESRTRPCLLYQIKRCSGPCTNEVTAEAYAVLVSEAKDFLAGRSQKVKGEIAVSMQAAAENLDFERAAALRDRLAALSHVQSHQGINSQSVEEADIFAIHQEGGQFCIQVFFFRTGQNWGNRAYFPKADVAVEPGEVLGSFIAQFYDDKPCPRLLLLSLEVEDEELLGEALSERMGFKVSLAVPQRGEKKELVDHAVHNAREALGRRLAETSTQTRLLAEALSERMGFKVALSVPQRGEKKELVDHAVHNAREALGRRLAETSTQTRLLAGFAETFGLPHPPRRIEIYDNSHIMGTNAVGAMVVAGPEGFNKSQYRRFNIRAEGITPGDDFGMMREVMTRRFSRLLREHAGGPAPQEPASEAADDAAFPAWPDVILIDGGQGQMSAVRGILDELGIRDRIEAIGVAKGVDRDAGRERFFVEGRESFSLPVRDPVLYFVQRLRDEAHRFAIGSHRARRSRELVKNPLDEIGGIGPARKRALLTHFGTAKAVSRAAIADLMAVQGISESTAKIVYDHFHEN